MASSIVSGRLGGYSAEFLTPEQQERFTFVKTKLCGNKAVDVANLEKNGMHSVVVIMRRMQWTRITTFSETLFDVSTSGHSGVHSVDTQAKGLGIIGSEFRLKDGKLDINQLNAFNRLLHFVVCHILVPRSATFSTCTKADSNMMYWAVQNQEINMAEVMMERMKFARDKIWDTKSKLNVSLPYAHLLTKVFQHFGVDVSGAVVEKMGQAIRYGNLRKNGFSVVNGVWTKTSVAEGEPIIGEAQDVQLEAAAIETEGPSAVAEPTAVEAAVSRASQEVAAMENPVAQGNVVVEDSVRSPEDPLPTSSMASVLRQVLDSIHSTSVIQNTGGNLVEEVVASGHLEESVTAAPIQKESSISPEEIGEREGVEEGAPIQGEQEFEQEAAVSQGEQTSDTPANERSNTVHPEDPEQVEKRSKKIAHRRPMKIPKKMNLKPILKRLDDQGSTDSTPHPSIPQSTTSDVPRPSGPSLQECGPPGQSEGISGPSGPIVVDQEEQPSGISVDAPAGPSGPSIATLFSESLPILDADVSKGSEPSGPEIAEGKQSAEVDVAESAVAPEAPESSFLATPAPSSPPTSSTAPPAPTTFKRPRPRPISSPTPFPSQSGSSPISSTIVLSPPSSPQIPPASSSAGPSSCSGPSTSGPSTLPTITPASIFIPPTPPSFITIIPEGAQLTQVEIQDIKDEFEVAILHSVLAVGTHTHRTGSSSPVSKKRRLTSTHPISSDTCYPPLWFSLSLLENTVVPMTKNVSNAANIKLAELGYKRSAPGKAAPAARTARATSSMAFWERVHNLEEIVLVHESDEEVAVLQSADDKSLQEGEMLGQVRSDLLEWGSTQGSTSYDSILQGRAGNVDFIAGEEDCRRPLVSSWREVDGQGKHFRLEGSNHSFCKRFGYHGRGGCSSSRRPTRCGVTPLSRNDLGENASSYRSGPLSRKGA
ncbi:hypothetical protein Taro_051554 [Colocasia esculenta]|uniref:Uncharacterized protein n=1 Tax=Colocasia esculenta TaxID=4460 RepID=A0A843XG91_COLES|nr:hypothetical protein [Colocasia esculenta]